MAWLPSGLSFGMPVYLWIPQGHLPFFEVSFMRVWMLSLSEVGSLITFSATDTKTDKEPPPAQRTVKGINAFEGETLKIALEPRDEARLGKFSSEGEGNRVLYFKRGK
jgi:hypothetical protein